MSLSRRQLSDGLWPALACSLALLLFARPVAAKPDEGGQCLLHQKIPVERLLRRVSLDLRGRPPSYEEYAAVKGESELPDAVIDAYLASDDFRVQMRRFHESILWTNPFGNAVIGGAYDLAEYQLAPDFTVWFDNTYTKPWIFRGGNGYHGCQNKPQSELGWDEKGVPNAEYMGHDGTDDWYAEGWVEVQPYWAPDTTIKVCAFDAQEALTFTHTEKGVESTYSCGTRHALYFQSCGCGPKLQWCVGTGGIQTRIWTAMREQLLRLVDDHIDGTRKYSGLLTTKRAHYNDVLIHFHKYLAPKTRTNVTVADYFPADGDFPDIDELDWVNPSWRVIERKGVHAGILTLPAYSLRFQTNRGRANRFRMAFMGQYFQPPDVLDYKGCDPTTDNLVNRCMCRKCHITLEPLAAYFGQVIEQGTSMLSGLAQSCKTKKECAKVGAALGYGPSFAYTRFYTEVQSEFDEDHSIWRLRALEYASDAQPEIQKNFDAGPAGLAKWAVEEGHFARATIKSLFVFLMHREMVINSGAAADESELLEELATEFRAHDDFSRIVKRIVQLPQYRRTP